MRRDVSSGGARYRIRGGGRTAWLLALLLVASPPVPAASFQDGLAAYREGAHDRARALWTEAAEGGDARAMFSLGSLFAKGTGVEQDPVVSYGWFLRAAEAGLPQAQYNVAFMLEQGTGVARDPAAALGWYERAAVAGLPQAQAAFAARLWDGRGVEPNPPVALRWFESAARQGHPEAQNSLATMLEGGIGTAADPAAAATWYRRAAEQGVRSAQASLARLYRSGLGVPEDARQADYWAARARGEREDEAPPGAPAGPRPQVAAAPTAASPTPPAPPEPSPPRDEKVVVQAEAPKPAARLERITPPPPSAQPPAEQQKSEPPEKPPAPAVVERAVPPAPAPSKPAAPEPAAGASGPGGWFDAAPADHHTVQLIASGSLKALERFIARNGLDDRAEILRSQRDGRDWYTVVYGDFPDRAGANAALAALPEAARKNGPWVRSVAEVRKAIGR